MQIEYSNFYYQLEGWLRGAIRTAHPFSWDENHLTFSIVDALGREASSIELTGMDRPFKLVWDARKLRLPEEADFGDMAVVVKLKTWAGEMLEGVGFLEAKRRDLRGSNFPAAKTSQLNRILRKAPSANLLLYDYDNVSSCMDNLATFFEDHYYKRRFGPGSPFTHSICVPVRIAVQQGQYSTHLHKFGVPLSYQLLGRYFRGFDLETERSVIEAAKGNIAKHGGARTLLLVGVSTGEQEPELPEVNDNLYTRVG